MTSSHLLIFAGFPVGLLEFDPVGVSTFGPDLSAKSRSAWALFTSPGVMMPGGLIFACDEWFEVRAA